MVANYDIFRRLATSKAAPSARNVNIQFLRRAVYTRPLGRPFILYRTRFSIQYTDTFQFIHDAQERFQRAVKDNYSDQPRIKIYLRNEKLKVLLVLLKIRAFKKE